jgi:hypothetical protein
MMKIITSSSVKVCLVFLFFSFISVTAQSVSITWPLNADGNPIVTGDVSANTVAIGTNLSSPTFASNYGITAAGWSDDANNFVTNEYYEFSVTPNSNTELIISTINFQHSISNGNWNAAVYYSTNDFSTATLIGTNFTSNSTSPVQRNNSVAINVNNSTLKIRIYAWESDGRNRSFRIRNFEINGSTCLLPIISTQPISLTKCSGQVAIFSVNASSVNTYQWRKNGINITNATSSSYTIATTAVLDSGNYDVVLTSLGNCSLVSNSATLLVSQEPVVTVVPLTSNICLGEVLPMQAQIPATIPIAISIGSGINLNNPTGNNNSIFPSPYAAHYENVKQQYLILASELSAAGFLSNSEITSLSFDVATLGTSGLHRNYTISIGTTTQSAISSWQSGLSVVFGPVNYQPMNGINTHDFTNSFMWNGTSNIIVQLCHTNDSSNSGNFKTANAIIEFSTTSFASSLVYRVDNSVACSNNSVTYTESQRPNMLLSGYTKPTLVWSPSTELFINTLGNIPYDNSNVELVYAKPTENRNYVATATASNGCQTSKEVAITVNPITNWLGVTNLWDDAVNWSCGFVPTSKHDVTIPNTLIQPIITSTAFSKNLTIQTDAVLTISSASNLTVSDVITLSGNIVQQNNSNLIQINDAVNSGSGKLVLTRDSPPLMRLDYMLWSSPVLGQLMQEFSPATLSNRFYSYNSASNLYVPIANPAGTSFESATGFLIRMPNNHPTTPTIWNGQFTGIPNNGMLSKTVTSGTYNAVGNPYPSTIDADLFILANDLTDPLYFWRKTNNPNNSSYATYTLAGGVGTSNSADPLGLIPNGIIQIGQGFIIKSTASNVVFTNQMRINNTNNQIFRTNQNDKSRIWLNLKNETDFLCQTMVGYMFGATPGIDAAIDGSYINDSQTALTSIIDNQEFTIQAKGLPFEVTDEIPLGFKTTNAGNFSIEIDHFDGFFAEDQSIYLRDNLTNNTHNIKLSEYTFTSNSGVYNSRFKVVFQNSLSTGELNNSPDIVVYSKNQEIFITAGESIISEIKIIDSAGRLLFNKVNIESNETSVVLNRPSQILFIQITLIGGKQLTKKIIN